LAGPGPDAFAPASPVPAPAPEKSPEPILAVEGLSCSIDGFEILHDVSLSLAKGEFLSILGPNGAGKSTLLKCLMRLNDRGRTRGSVTIAGSDLAACGQKRLARLASYVPQAGGWIPPFTVRDFARLSRYPYSKAVSGLTEADERAVDRAIDLCGLGPLAGRPLKTLSGGERQRAYLAAALAQETEIMLLDEPAASLDPRHASELAALLRELNRGRGLTMLMITHDLNHPLRAGGQALVLKSGRRLYFGPVDGLLDRGILEAAFDHRFTYLDHPSGSGRVVLSE
jgi:iron complex transport system ATP-binding protein